MCTLPFLHAVLWFCIRAAGNSMHRSAIWLENIGTTGFDSAHYYLHADTSFRRSGTGRCFDVAVSIPGEAC